MTLDMLLASALRGITARRGFRAELLQALRLAPPVVVVAPPAPRRTTRYIAGGVVAGSVGVAVALKRRAARRTA
ncbi:MAG TPA: hypothetical protein VM573_09435 [Actinomycetota bacterium]|jgi:hypothetical protein|nr:hypothetical protein [Actinomycetota bacterium]